MDSVSDLSSSLLPRVPFFHLTKAGVTLTVPLEVHLLPIFLEAVDALHNSESFLCSRDTSAWVAGLVGL